MSKLRHDLEERGFTFTKPPHTHFQAKTEKVSLSLYLSGKLTVQGAGSSDFIEFVLPPYLHPIEPFEAHIGSDEAGKGDFFGPLCVCAVFVSEESLYYLRELGVKDSKQMKDERILEIAKDIENHTFSQTICLFPETYNRVYKRFGNLNKLMAWAHFEVLQKVSLKSGCHKALVDQFAHEGLIDGIVSYKKSLLQIEQRTKAESDIAVASASILARASFLEGLAKLETDFQVNLPKGASNSVNSAAVKIAKECGTEVLDKVCKTHFKTYAATIERL